VDISRREFFRTIALGSLATPLLNGVARAANPPASGKVDIGVCKSVSVTCISEVGWLSGDRLLADVKAAGGFNTNQWTIAWTPKNGAGSCSLIDVEAMDGKHHRFLLDSGWSPAFMEKRFRQTGVDRLLRSGKISFVYLSHEHMDHLWGIQAVLKHKPDIRIVVPSTIQPEGLHLLRGAEFMVPHATNRIHHTGEVVKLSPGQVNEILPGCASVTFDDPIILGIQGEQSLYFNIRNRGIVCVTGCCHQTVANFVAFARERLVDGDNLFGLYGGLHIAPFGPLKPKQEAAVEAISKLGFQKIAANHCTGLPAVRRLVDLGCPVVRGTGQDGSESDLYVGNGDSVTFG